jgi:hypothetical protein
MPKIDAANWIPVREDLETDSRVLAIAEAITGANRHYILGPSAPRDLFGDPESVTRDVMRDITIVALLRVWAAFTHHTKDGVIRHASSLSHLDTIARLRGFGQAMSTVGWAVHDPATQTITLPNFTEYNAPNKNGERQKTAAARRQQAYRDRLKGQTTPGDQPSTVDVTDRHEPDNRDVTRNVTPSISDSVSPSDSDSLSESPHLPISQSPPLPSPDPDPLGTLKKKINALRPCWQKAPHWSAEEEHALYESRANLAAMESQDWLLLAWFFKWANSAANTGSKEPVRVSAKRAMLCADLAALLDRATTAWKQNGCPKLAPAATAGTPARKAPPPPVLPELPPAQNAAAFAGLLTDLGIKRTPKPAAA